MHSSFRRPSLIHGIIRSFVNGTQSSSSLSFLFLLPLLGSVLQDSLNNFLTVFLKFLRFPQITFWLIVSVSSFPGSTLTAEVVVEDDDRSSCGVGGICCGFLDSNNVLPLTLCWLRKRTKKTQLASADTNIFSYALAYFWKGRWKGFYQVFNIIRDVTINNAYVSSLCCRGWLWSRLEVAWVN